MPAFERVRREFMRRLEQTTHLGHFDNTDTHILDTGEDGPCGEFVKFFVNLGFGRLEVEAAVVSLGHTTGGIDATLSGVEALLDSLEESAADSRGRRNLSPQFGMIEEAFPWPLIDMAEFGIIFCCVIGSHFPRCIVNISANTYEHI